MAGATIQPKAGAAHRLRTAPETLALIRPHLAELGITRVANITGLDRIGIPTVVVSRPNARSLSVSQGKGFDLDSAKVSGIMEALELHHAEHCLLPLLLASYAELKQRASVVDVARLPAFVRPFDPEVPLLWTQARQIGGGTAFVPFDMVHVNLTFPLPPHSGYFPMGSNGLASGNSLSEAIVHGACELIERDALALFHRMSAGQQQSRRLAIDSVDDLRCRELLDRYAAADIAVVVWDITSDVGVPSYFCSIVERELNPFHRVGPANGFGCHLHPGEALKRALTEAAQSRLTRIAGSRDDMQTEDIERLRSDAAILRRQSLILSAAPATCRFQAHPRAVPDSLEGELDVIVQLLTAVGLERLYYVDLSSQALPVHVARVIVPGLEGADEVPGYVAGARALAWQADGEGA
jgi:YcaO-like protein with predicted kinase domain